MLLGLWVALTGHAMRGAILIALGALVKPYVAPALASIWRPWDWKMPAVVIAANRALLSSVSFRGVGGLRFPDQRISDGRGYCFR